MYWFISLWLYNIISTRAFILQDTYNVLLKDDKDYKVDLIITEDDYEMIDEKHLKEFKLDKEKEKFKELHKMAENDNFEEFKIKTKMMKQPYEPSLRIISAKRSVENKMTTTNLEPRPISKINKRQIENQIDDVYDYEELVNEYNDQANNESQSSNAYQISAAVDPISQYGILGDLMRLFSYRSDINCSYEEGIGLKAVNCLIEDYNSRHYSLRDVMGRLWRIFLIWFLVYLAVAIPLWCTRGWCCCCLCCKFFKPRETIEEAKRYVVLYPPGTFKTKSGVILYEPTDREKECYEEFEHFIKIL